MINGNSVSGLISKAIWPIIYFGLCGLAIFVLWKIRGRQPGNTSYSVAIYCGIGGCMLLMLLGFKIFGVF